MRKRLNREGAKARRKYVIDVYIFLHFLCAFAVQIPLPLP